MSQILHTEQSSIGDRVLAYWIYDGYWYPATIRSIDGTNISVEYDDGQYECLADGYATPIDIEIGDVVQCRRNREEFYHDAVVIEKTEKGYIVQYDDDSKENVLLSLIRVDQDIPIHWQTRRGFWLLVEKTDNCWWWRIHKRGQYERATTYSSFDRHATHRLAYRLTWGKIPGEYVVRHRCGNAACVNPDHLFIGEHWENMLDEVARRRNRINPGEVFSYENEIDYFIKDFEIRLGTCSSEDKPDLAYKLKIMQGIKEKPQI